MNRSLSADRRRLSALRVAAQGLGTPSLASAAEVVRHLTAMQAQDFGGAKWAIALRTPTLTESDVDAAIAAREIVRSWPMRGTLHFTAAEDLGWMLQLTGERTIRSAAGRHRRLGLDATHFALARGTAESLLSGGRVVGRAELLRAFAEQSLDVTENRGNHLLQYLSASGILVFGPPDGRSQTFALLEEWVTSPRLLGREEALAEWALRYFTGHGPATVRDFAWWSSLTLTDARRGLAAVESRLESIDVAGTSYLHAAGLEPAAPTVLALPGFDEYVLGYQDRSAQLAPEFASAIVPGGNGMFLPTIVVDGEICGTWRRVVTARRVSVEPVLFRALPQRAIKGFAAAAARYGGYLNRTASII